MWKYITVILFYIIGFTKANGQTVQVCITVDGLVMPLSKLHNLCRKDTVVLAMTNCAATPETNISYRWRNLNVPPNTDSLSSTIMAKDTGRWVGYIINNNTLVEYTDTIHLIHPPVINIVSISPAGTSVCPLTQITLSLVETGPIVSHQWYDRLTPPGFVLIPGATNPTFSFTDKPKFVTVVANDVYGCTDSINSGYFPLSTFTPNVNIGPDPAPICVGDVINFQNIPLSVQGGLGPIMHYYYRDGVLINADTLSPPSNYVSANVPFPTVGTVQVLFRAEPYFPGGCRNEDIVTVTVLPIPTVNLGNDTLLCYGSSLTITPTLVGTGPYNASSPGLGWSSAPAGYTSSTTTTTVSPTVTTTYTLRVEDVNVCGVGQDDIVVSVNPQININLSSDVTICKLPLVATPLNATVNGGLAPYTFAWSPMDSLTTPIDLATSSSTNANPINTTTYTFTALDANNCSANNSVTVTTYEPEIAPIASPIIISETVNTTMVALLPSNETFNFAWTDTTGASYGTENFLYREYEGPDTVVYVITVTDPNNNCQNKDSIEVWSISDNILLYVPNIFSPNAQNPTNQRLRIYGDNLLPSDFKMIVYNKWGNLVYESTDLADTQANGWDGGAMVEGVYTYVIIGKFKNGKDVNESPNYKGTFSLVR